MQAVVAWKYQCMYLIILVVQMLVVLAQVLAEVVPAWSLWMQVC
jgi:hypothetical protein